MLSATGRAPVNSLTGGSTDVAIAKNILDESKAMVQKMQDIVFCMEVEANELKKELEFRQNRLESEIH